MSHPPGKPAMDLFVPRLAAFYVAHFIVAGIQMPFFPVWLDAHGLDARAIGVVLAAPMVVRIFAVPAATRLADRFGVLRGALITAAAAATAGYALVGMASGFVPILVAVTLASVAYGPIFPLTDTYALRGLAERRRAYGPVRLWGSAAFMAANISAGLVLGIIAPVNLIWLIVAALGFTMVAATGLAATSEHAPQTDAPAPHAPLWRMPVFVAALAAVSLIQASHALFYGFATLDWTARGLDGPTIGVLWALAVVAEIVLFAFSGRLPRWIGPVELMALGACGAVIRWTAMAFEPPLAALPFLQCLHALSFGATHLGALQFIVRVAPARMAATAQGDLSAAQSVVMFGVMSLSGVLYAAYGGHAYAVMAAVAAAGGLIVFGLLWQERHT